MSWLTKFMRVTEDMLPETVLRKVEEMSNVRPCQVGDSDVVDGYWIESHTLGCRNAADDPEEEWWDRHWDIFEEYRDDPLTVIFGDPADGVFVTVTPTIS